MYIIVFVAAQKEASFKICKLCILTAMQPRQVIIFVLPINLLLNYSYNSSKIGLNV